MDSKNEWPNWKTVREKDIEIDKEMSAIACKQIQRKQGEKSYKTEKTSTNKKRLSEKKR